jgi:tetratricopeptide (TPR) repeat protein
MAASSVRARWALTLALATAVAPLPRPAFAQTAPPPSQADALFAEGRDLLEKGKYPEACAKLARSEELSAAVGTLLNLGYCYEQVGKLRSALDAYVEAATLATAVGDTKRATFARERQAAVEPRAPKLVVRVVPPEPAGLEITRNGVPLKKSDLDRPIAVDAEDYVITASAPGYTPWKAVFLVRGEGAVMTVMVPPLEAPTGAPVVAAPAQTSPITPRRIAALGLGALSALSLGAGIAAGLSAKSRYDDASSHCDPTGCDDTGASIQHGAAAQGNLATALVALGVLSAGAAVFLWFVRPPEHKPPARQVGVGVSPFGAALEGRF